ncbi:MAG: SCO family protein [Acidiferrobacterales bacterium]
MNEQTEKKVKTSNRIKIILVAAIFMAPVVAATVLKLTGWRPAQTGNYGELIQPARPLTNVGFRTSDGGRVAISDYQRTWLMVTFVSGYCDEFCKSNIYKMRQVHAATGKHYKRVQRLLVLTNKASSKLLNYLKAYPDMTVVNGPAKAVRDLASQLQTNDGTALDGLNRIYFIDPLGNFMMTYDRNADPGNMRKDLRRLLRVSHIG